MARQFRSVVSGPGSVNRFLIPANVEDTTPPLPTTDLRATKNVAQETILKRRNMGGDGSHETDPSPGDSVPDYKSYDDMNREAASRSKGDPGGRPGFTDKGLGARTSTSGTIATALANVALTGASTFFGGWPAAAIRGASIGSTVKQLSEGVDITKTKTLGRYAATAFGFPETDRDEEAINKPWSKAKKEGVPAPKRVGDPKIDLTTPLNKPVSGDYAYRTGWGETAKRPGKPTVEELDDLTRERTKAGIRYRLDTHAMINLRQAKQEAQSEALGTRLAKEVIAQETAVTAAAAKADTHDPKKGQPPISIPVWRGSASPTSVNGRSGDTGSFDEDEGSPGGGGSQQAGTFDDPSEEFDLD